MCGIRKGDLSAVATAFFDPTLGPCEYGWSKIRMSVGPGGRGSVGQPTNESTSALAKSLVYVKLQFVRKLAIESSVQHPRELAQ